MKKRGTYSHLIAKDPSLVADKEEREPRKSPIGVRATPTIQTSITITITINKSIKFTYLLQSCS